MIIILASIILAIVYFPSEVLSIFGGVVNAVFYPFTAFIHGLFGVVVNFFTGLWHSLTSAVTGGASYVYHHTIGAL